MGGKIKEWRVSRQEKSNQEDEFWESDLLLLQGLKRCDDCQNPYPLSLDNCPNCKPKSI
jgi:predicted amidophosphoribosyltransferase